MNPLVFGIDDCYLMSQTGQLDSVLRQFSLNWPNESFCMLWIKQSILKEHNIFGDNIKLLKSINNHSRIMKCNRHKFYFAQSF